MAPERLAILDAWRNKRNLSDYTGKLIDPASLRTCISEAEQLLDHVNAWLKANHPTLTA